MDLHGPTISHLSFDRSIDVRFRLIIALRNTGIAVQSVQDAADANMFRSDSGETAGFRMPSSPSLEVSSELQ